MSRYEERDYRDRERDSRDYRDDRGYDRDRYGGPPPPPARGPPAVGPGTGRTTLYVTGFSDRHRAAELARIFEKVGPIVRCDIPATRIPHARQIAFVEYVKPEDADYAYSKLDGTSIDGYPLRVEFARQQPSARWRRDGPPPPPPAGGPPPRGGYSDRARSPPPRRPRSPSPRRGGRLDDYDRRPPPPRGDERDRDRDRDYDRDRLPPPPPPSAPRDDDRRPIRDDDRRRSLSPDRR